MPGLGHGFGFGGGKKVAATRRAPPPVEVALISPSLAWTGTPGSGFVAAPVDPVRTTAKPAVRLIVPPFQWFTDELLVGVYAGANDGGSLMETMGLQKVICHYEGASTDILSPSFQTFNDANGVPRTYFGWWIKLKRDGRNGHAHIYFEAVPRDASMQNRVIGPFQFSPQAMLHDYEVTVAPSQEVIAGSRYQSIGAALGYLRTAGAQNPLITFTEAVANHPMNGPGVAWYLDNGWCTVTATAPVSFTFTTGNTARAMRPQVNGLRLQGANITLDYEAVGELYKEVVNARDHWLDGCNLINPAGRNHLINKLSRSGLAWLVRGKPWFTECTFTSLWNTASGANLVRGCTFTNGYSDIANAACVINNVVTDHDSSWHRTYVPALSVQFTGAEATATLAMSGSNGANNRVITATWGATSATFTVVNNALGDFFDVADVVAWLNTLPGWSATLLDDTRAAVYLEASGAFGAWGPVSAKASALTLFTFIDIHADFVQLFGENAVIADNRLYDGVSCQNIFLSDGFCNDFLVVNNAFANIGDPLTGSRSQSNRAHSHVVMAHNTWANQGYWLRTSNLYNPDAYCLFVNNTMHHLSWIGPVDADLVLADNHLQDGATSPAGSTGTVISGTEASLFSDAQGGNFAPAGALKANKKPPVMKYDLNQAARGNMAPVGAVK